MKTPLRSLVRLRHSLWFGLTAAMLLNMAFSGASFGQAGGCNCANFSLINPDFEQPGGISGFAIIPETSVPGWKTTASDHMIEIWHSGFGGVPSQSGTYFVELQANQPGA